MPPKIQFVHVDPFYFENKGMAHYIGGCIHQVHSRKPIEMETIGLTQGHFLCSYPETVFHIKIQHTLFNAEMCCKWLVCCCLMTVTSSWEIMWLWSLAKLTLHELQYKVTCSAAFVGAASFIHKNVIKKCQKSPDKMINSLVVSVGLVLGDPKLLDLH